MAVYKRAHTWWFRLQVRGVRYARSVPEATTKKQAQAAETRFRNELLQGKYDLIDQGTLDITLVQYSKQYLKWSKEHKRSHNDDVWRMAVLNQSTREWDTHAASNWGVASMVVTAASISGV